MCGVPSLTGKLFGDKTARLIDPVHERIVKPNIQDPAEEAVGLRKKQAAAAKPVSALSAGQATSITPDEEQSALATGKRTLGA